MTNFNNSINRQRLSAVRPWQIVAIVAVVYMLIALAGNGFVPKNLAIIAIAICIILVEWILDKRHAADAAGMIT